MSSDSEVPVTGGTKGDQYGMHTYLSAAGNEVVRGKSAQLGFWSSLSLFIGLVIGSGVFASTGEVYGSLGTYYGSMVVWLLAGILSLMGSFVYAELGAAIPEAGAEHAYLYRAFGSSASFLFSWSGWLTRPTIVATLSLAMSKYAYSLFTGTRDDQVEGSEFYVVLISVVAIVLISIYCCLSKLSSKWVQNVLAVLKIGSLVVFSITGLYYLGVQGGKFADDMLTEKEKAEERRYLPDDPFLFNEGVTSLSHICTSLFLALWGFDGWSNLNLVALEMSHPSRDLPRVMLVGVSLTTVFYLLMNTAYTTVITSSKFIGVETVSSFAQSAYGDAARPVALAIVAISVFGALNSAIFCNTEVCFAAAADDFAPKIFSYVHPRLGTPIFSLVFQSVGALVLTLAFGVNYSALVNFYSIPVWIFYASSGAALLRLRKTEPDLHRPFKTNKALAYVYIIVSAFMIIFSFIDAYIEACVATGFLLLGIVVWYAFVYRGYRFTKSAGAGVKLCAGVAPTTDKKFKLRSVDGMREPGPGVQI